MKRFRQLKNLCGIDVGCTNIKMTAVIEDEKWGVLFYCTIYILFFVDSVNIIIYIYYLYNIFFATSKIVYLIIKMPRW